MNKTYECGQCKTKPANFRECRHRRVVYGPCRDGQSGFAHVAKEFYEELDTMALIEKESKDAISLAIEIAKKEGFSDQEIEQLIREYLKDYVPKGTLNEWLRTQD